MVRVESIQVGMPNQHLWEAPHNGWNDEQDRQWVSGIYKTPISGPVYVGRLNLHGDAQADLEHHGGADRPVLAYSADHYRLWQEELGLELPYGAFGENLTLSGISERDVCIGDIVQIGEVLLQVSQPRRPCWKLARRNGISDLAARVLKERRSGWYLRVLQEGYIEQGMTVALLERHCPEWTIVTGHDVMDRRKVNPDMAHELAQCPYLSADWRRDLGSI